MVKLKRKKDLLMRRKTEDSIPSLTSFSDVSSDDEDFKDLSVEELNRLAKKVLLVGVTKEDFLQSIEDAVKPMP